MKKLLIGNWKMNMFSSEAAELALGISKITPWPTNCDLWVAPTFLSLPAVAQNLRGTKVGFGCQNVAWEDSGAFTGEVSVPMLKEFGASFAIVGHSERRHVCGESDELVAKRAALGASGKFTIVFCIGEKLEERTGGQTASVLKRQMDPVLKLVGSNKQHSLVIAYEPVWAIGTGKVATLDEIRDTHAIVADYWQEKLGFECPAILYGGSVTPENIAEIIKVPKVGGALVGGASLKLDKFRAMAAAIG